MNPEKEVKMMWDILKRESETKGIEEIGKASAIFEHCFEFWGTWRVKKPGLTVKQVSYSDNWPNGVKIIDAKPV